VRGVIRPSDSRFKTLNFLFMVGLLLASFDIALNIEINDLSFRTAQIAHALFMAFYFLTPRPKNEPQNSTQPLGFKWLLFWGLFLVVWTPNTYHLGFSIAYTCYFIFSVLLIYVSVQVFGHSDQRIYALLRGYVLTFVFVASFGMVQFVAGLVGIDLLVTQWWRVGSLPRLNGFSYEPSYYATYLIAGWGMLVWMIERKVYLFRKRLMYSFFLVVTLAIILSSSRMGILIIGIYLVYYFAKECLFIFTKFKVRFGFLKVIGFAALAVTGLSLLVVVTVGADSLRFLLIGTGLGGTANHSASMRIGQFEDTLILIGQSPIIGYGLGGVLSNIAYLNGINLEEATGMNITIEVLAASGVFGFIFFVMFIAETLYGAFSYAHRRDPLAQCLAAAGLGFVLLYTILQFNQNIMRLFFWNHLAVIAVIYCQVSIKYGAAARRKLRIPSKTTVASRSS